MFPLMRMMNVVVSAVWLPICLLPVALLVCALPRSGEKHEEVSEEQLLKAEKTGPPSEVLEAVKREGMVVQKSGTEIWNGGLAWGVSAVDKRGNVWALDIEPSGRILMKEPTFLTRTVPPLGYRVEVPHQR
jgi:hypothetical protein